MSNSSLVTYTRISPNKTVMSNKKNTHIVIHHMAGNLSVEECGAVFAPSSRQASSNYGVDGKGNVGLYVEEKDRSWATANREIDSKAVTIEVANDQIGGNWHVSDTALNKTIELCVDICKRNNIKKLVFTGDKSGNLHAHKWYASTDCPGPYLYSKFSYIANEVNKKLNGGSTPTPQPTPTPSPSTGYKIGDIIELKPGATYYDGTAIPNWVFNSTLYYRGANANGIIFSTQKTGDITGVVKPDAVKGSASAGYLVKIDAKSLNVRKGPGTEYPITTVVSYGEVFTIVDEDEGWGLLKSYQKDRNGWIYLKYTEPR